MNTCLTSGASNTSFALSAGCTNFTLDTGFALRARSASRYKQLPVVCRRSTSNRPATRSWKPIQRSLICDRIIQGVVSKAIPGSLVVVWLRPCSTICAGSASDTRLSDDTSCASDAFNPCSTSDAFNACGASFPNVALDTGGTSGSIGTSGTSLSLNTSLASFSLDTRGASDTCFTLDASLASDASFTLDASRSCFTLNPSSTSLANIALDTSRACFTNVTLDTCSTRFTNVTLRTGGTSFALDASLANISLDSGSTGFTNITLDASGASFTLNTSSSIGASRSSFALRTSFPRDPVYYGNENRAIIGKTSGTGATRIKQGDRIGPVGIGGFLIDLCRRTANFPCLVITAR